MTSIPFAADCYFSQSSITANDVNSHFFNTAIIISSDWIPTHPSTIMIDTVINSSQYLIGLPPRTPIFITVDHFATEYSDTEGTIHANETKMKALEEYVQNLFHKYLTPATTHSPVVHILPAVKHLHIAGNVMKALDLIAEHYPSVEYLYYLQHDFPFVRAVNHLALVDMFEKYPNKVNSIRFKYYPTQALVGCGDETDLVYDISNISNYVEYFSNKNAVISQNVTLHPTQEYSDNNHLVRFHWYREMMAGLRDHPVGLYQPPEYPFQGTAEEACNAGKPLGLYMYVATVMQHLDGKRTFEYNETNWEDVLCTFCHYDGNDPDFDQGG